MKTLAPRLLVLGAGPVGVEMAQAVRRLGGEVVPTAPDQRVLPREPAKLGDALGDVLRRDGIELILGPRTTRPPFEGGDGTEACVLTLDDGRELRGENLLVATGRRLRVRGIGLETVGVKTRRALHAGGPDRARGREPVGRRRRDRTSSPVPVTSAPRREWLQQAPSPICTRVPLEVLRDTAQPFSTFSEIYVEALKALRDRIVTERHPAESQPSMGRTHNAPGAGV